MPASRRGTGFINFQDYLGLNQTGAQQLGVGLAETQRKSNDALEGSINRGALDFQKRVDAGAPTPGGTYTGPRQMDTAGYDVGLAQQQAKAGLLSDNTGRAQLLAQQYGGDNTWGGSQLDAALAGAGGGAQAIAASQAGTARLKDFLGLVSGNVAAYAGRAAGQSAPQAAAPAPYQRSAQPAPSTQAFRDRVERNRQDRHGRERDTYYP